MLLALGLKNKYFLKLLLYQTLIAVWIFKFHHTTLKYNNHLFLMKKMMIHIAFYVTLLHLIFKI